MIGYNAATKEFYTDRSNAGNAKMNEKRLNEFIRTDRYDSTVHIQILLDKSSLEAFFNNGEKVVTTCIYPGKDASGLSVFAKGGTATIQSLTIWDLSKADKE